MPARRSDQTRIRTKLARLRVERGIDQKTMAQLLGMGLTAYQALERGDENNPRIGNLANAARVLDVNLAEVVEREWLQWHPVPGHATPPEPDEIWHTAPSSSLAQERAMRRPTQRQALEAMRGSDQQRS